MSVVGERFAQVVWRGYVATMRRLERMGLHVYLVELGDDDPDIAMPDLPEGYSVRPIALEELSRWAGRVEGLSEGFLADAAARGDRCVANFFNGQLIGYGFVARRRAPVTEQLQIVIDARLIYRYKGWTHPDHRRRHLSHARGRVNRTLFPLGEGQRTVSYVASHTLPSRLKHKDVHPVWLGYCGFVRVFGREYPFTGRVPRRYGFELRRVADPARR
jgi:hypothetical protein